MMQKKAKWKKVLPWLILGIAVLAVAISTVWSFLDVKVSKELTVEEAQVLLDEELDAIPLSVAKGSRKVLEESKITVTKVSYGSNKDVILHCEFETVNVGEAVRQHGQSLVNDTYALSLQLEEEGKKPNATALRLKMAEKLNACVESAEHLTGEIDFYLYEVAGGKFQLYLDDEALNTCFGGLIEAKKIIDGITTVEYDGETVDITNNNTVRTAMKDNFQLSNYDSVRPETGNFLIKAYRDFVRDFKKNFIEENRWVLLAKGLGTTLSITALAGLLGLMFGFLVAIVRCTNQMTGKLVVIDKICQVYLTVIRGTPVMVQLLIIYFVVLLPIGVPKFLSAVLCFGFNSGAYVAEIVRGGIMSIDKGQMEAGRSLGFGYAQSMVFFIMPQAFKAVLPALANEFITLLKESSVAFYIGVADLTKGGLQIRSVTYSNFMPLIAVALIYLIIVVVLTKLVGLLERRLRKSEK